MRQSDLWQHKILVKLTFNSGIFWFKSVNMRAIRLMCHGLTQSLSLDKQPCAQPCAVIFLGLSLQIKDLWKMWKRSVFMRDFLHVEPVEVLSTQDYRCTFTRFSATVHNCVCVWKTYFYRTFPDLWGTFTWPFILCNIWAHVKIQKANQCKTFSR